MKNRISKSSMIIVMVTLHTDSCTKSRVITYRLDSSSWIHGAALKENRVPKSSMIIVMVTLHEDSRTKNRVISYF